MCGASKKEARRFCVDSGTQKFSKDSKRLHVILLNEGNDIPKKDDKCAHYQTNIT